MIRRVEALVDFLVPGEGVDAEFAVDWLTRFLELSCPEFMRRVDAGLATAAVGKRCVDDPWGEPWGVFTVLTVDGRVGVLSRRRLATARAKGRLESIGVTAYLLDGEGVLQKSVEVDGKQVELSVVARVRRSLGGGVEVAFESNTANADPMAAIPLLRECVSDQVVFGDVRDRNSDHRSYGWRMPWLPELESGLLRDCNWVTVIRPDVVAAFPAGLLDRLPAQVFRVESMGGSLWVQATETLAEFGPEEHRALQEVLGAWVSNTPAGLRC